MPPKPGISKKTEKKIQEKIIEDKTFGLKNKNKSKVVQNFVKSVAVQVKGINAKGGESKRLADEYAAKEEKKKDAEKQAFLNTLFKTVKKVQEEVEEEVPEETVEDKYEDIDVYVDQREQIYKDTDELPPDVAADLEVYKANRGKTEKICRFFLDAVEGNKYGWRWICPNGIPCIYKHCLPAGFTLRRDQGQEGKKEEGILEERLEIERAMIDQGTPVTLERFLKWKEEKKLAREKENEKKRQDEAKKSGGKGLNVLSGRALFTYDPTLFQDDAEAAGNDDYEEEVIPEEEEEKEGVEYEEYDSDEGKEWGAAPGEEKAKPTEGAGGEAPKKKKKRRVVKKAEDDVKINEDVFMEGDDVDLPDEDM